MAATSMNDDGKRRASCADRATVTRPSSTGWRRSSSALPPELGKLVQKKDAVMGQADFARPGDDPAADQPGVRDRMMGRPERPPHDRALSPRIPGRAVDLGHLDDLLEGHVGEDRGQPPGEHGFSRPGRPDEKNVVPPGRGHLEGPLDMMLAFDLPEIRIGRGGSRADSG